MTQNELRLRLAKRGIPWSCLFELTYRCNLKCVHCYTDKNNLKEMNTAEVYRTLNLLKKVGCISLILSGGEIFARKDIVEILQYARSLHFALRLFTNGTLINEALADKIAEVKPWVVEISLYGFRDTHEQITQTKGSFNNTIVAISLLKRRRIRVYVKSMVMKQNWAELSKLQQYVQRELKVQWRGIDGGLQISPCDNGNKQPLLFRLEDHQLKKYMSTALIFNKVNKKSFQIKRVNMDEHICGAAFTTCNITPLGELNPCVQIRVKGNNLRNKSFKEIWQEHPMFQQLRTLRRADKKECLGCENSSYCSLCLGIALNEQGALQARSLEACRLAKAWRETYQSLHKKRSIN